MSEDTTDRGNLQQDTENNLNCSTFEQCPHDSDHPYVMINRDLTRNCNLSFQARGFLFYFLSHAKGWKLNRSYIMKSQKIGKDKLKSMIDELIEAGHIHMEKIELPKGQRAFKYLVSELPRYKKIITIAENPPAENPPAENPPIKNNEVSKKNEEESICSEQSKKTDSKPKRSDFYFSVDEGKYVGITDQDMSQWFIAYPSVDLSQQIAKSIEWLKSNPTKARLKKKWRSYLTGWLSREEEKISNRQAYSASNAKLSKMNYDQTKDEWEPKKTKVGG